MDTPSARLLAEAARTTTVTDGQGRQLDLRRLTALDKLRLFKAVGPHLAQNPPYLGMAILACAVTAIDGVPVPAPATEQQVESLVARLGDAGIAAAATGMPPEPSLPEGADLAGNSAGTPISSIAST